MRPSGPACDVLPVPPARQLPSGTNDRIAWMRDLARAYTELAGEAIGYARVSALRTYYLARAGAVRNYSRATQKTEELVNRTQDKARFVQHEYPVRVLAVVAGAAFIAGVASRIWRSHSYESRCE